MIEEVELACAKLNAEQYNRAHIVQKVNLTSMSFSIHPGFIMSK